MFSLPEHSIAFEGLKERTHEYDFTLGSEFFDLVDIEDINSGDLSVKLALNKRGSMLDADVSLSGSIETICDRCARDMSMDIQGGIRQVFKTAGMSSEDTDDVIVVPSNEHEINLTNTFYECLMLALPQRRAHDLDDCDQDIVDKLYVNQEEESTPDPRWEALKGLAE